MVFNATQPRVRTGLPKAGQWAAVSHSEPSLSLGGSFSSNVLEQITNRHYDAGAPFIDMTDERLRDVRTHLDATGDFSHDGVRKAAEESYAAEHGYTVDEHARFISQHGDRSAWFGDPDALRRDIEQMRKDEFAATGR